MNNVLSNILRFLILLVVQVAICQKVSLFGYMSPALFLLALFLLPLEMPLSLQYLIGFASGFVVDAFAHTLGASSFACTLIMFFRRTWPVCSMAPTTTSSRTSTAPNRG